MTISRVRPGDPLSAASQNELVDSVNRLLLHNGGSALRAPLTWFELANALTYPSDTSQCPASEEAKAVWFDPQQETYGGTENSPSVTIYHPMALRDSNGNYVGLPALCPGDRVWCYWNLQSGRWEIVADREPFNCRAQLLGNLGQGDSVQAVVWRINPANTSGGLGGTDEKTNLLITVHDWFLGPGQVLPIGMSIKAEWFPDDRRFYVTNAACS
jgi:hypothetical protein